MSTESAAAKPAEKVKLSWPRQVRRWWRALKREQASPERLGVAIAVGVVVGCSPFLGLQVLLAVLLATVFRLNKLAVLLGVQISIPPLMPPIYFSAAQLGELVLQGKFLPMSWQTFRAMPAKELVATLAADLVVGGLLVGGALGAGLGALAVLLIRRHRARQQARGLVVGLADEELDALDDRLAGLPTWAAEYGAWKARLDPIYALVLPRLEGRQEVVDLGTGLGLLPVLLNLRQPATRIRAVEWDGRKASLAQRLFADRPQVRIHEGDARTFELGQPDAIVLLDVLHYDVPERQREWLLRCARALRPGGVLVLRELDPKGRKEGLAAVIDRLVVRLGWNRAKNVFPWPIAELVQALEGEGLSVEVQPEAARHVFKDNALVVATRAMAAAAAE